MFGLHASFTLNDSTLKEVSDFTNEYEMGIHVHLCEDPVDRKLSKEKNNKVPVDRLIKYNLLNEKSILSHAIHLNKREYDKIEKFGSAIAMNVDSNLNNSVGFINFNNLNKNIPLLAGTDGMHANPGRTIKNTFLLLRKNGLSFDESFDVIKKIYLDQLKFIKRYYYNSSQLKKGDRADFIIWDYIPPTPINSKNFFGHFIYGMLESRIHSTFQNGIILMKEGKLSLIDEEKAYRNIYKQGERLYSKMKRKR
jgi:cytosine/adenosine deaminase-related metal-dependent hydrolase